MILRYQWIIIVGVQTNNEKSLIADGFRYSPGFGIHNGQVSIYLFDQDEQRKTVYLKFPGSLCLYIQWAYIFKPVTLDVQTVRTVGNTVVEYVCLTVK